MNRKPSGIDDILSFLEKEYICGNMHEGNVNEYIQKIHYILNDNKDNAEYVDSVKQLFKSVSKLDTPQHNDDISNVQHTIENK